MVIEENKMFSLVSGAVVQVVENLGGDDWLCKYITGANEQVTLSGEFLRKFGEARS